MLDHEAGGVDIAEHGLTLDDLRDRARLNDDPRVFPLALASALADEVAWGRVVLDDEGWYRLVPDAFDPDVLAALRSLGTARRGA